MCFLNILANSWLTKSGTFQFTHVPETFPHVQWETCVNEISQLLAVVHFTVLVFWVFQDIVLTPFRFNHFGKDSKVFHLGKNTPIGQENACDRNAA